ncbi:hypothetical protein ES703_37229 [subsurface metagenome]
MDYRKNFSLGDPDDIKVHDFFKVLTVLFHEIWKILEGSPVFSPMPEKMVNQPLLVQSHKLLEAVE